MTTGATTVLVEQETGRVHVENEEQTLLDGHLGVRLADGTVVRPGDDDASLTTAVTLEAADGAADLTLTVTNEGDEPRRIQAFDLLDGTATFGPDDRVFEHGYQSWSPTATLGLDERFPPETERARPQMVDLAAPDDVRTSHGLTALTGERGTVTLGFLDHEAYLSRFEMDTDAEGTTQVRACCPADGVTLEPGESRASAPLRIDATRSLPDALAALAETIADRMDARVPERAPTGWCSWYHYFTEVTADDVRTNLDALDAWDADFDVVQLDDGYEVAFGDWRTLDEGFDDMRELREDVAAAGYTPGLWLAPFYVQADSDLAAAHPEWLLTRDGEPVDAGPRHGPMYALDTTHPGVERWLRETFETVVDEWGFDYLKLDFLYAAALPGDRTEDVTRATAYRHGLEVIREAVGETFVLGCGAPQFASVGLVDAMRVGPDTAPYWHRAGESASQPAHENAVRNVLNRQFTHRRLWLNDPDCQLVRSTTDLTSAERESFAALVALTGGTNVLSDALAEIDDAGRTLFERTLPPVTNGHVDGVGEREFPNRVVCERPADGAVAVAAFNWTDEPRTLRVDPRAHVDGTETLAWVTLASPTTDGEGDAETTPVVHDGVVERTVAPHGTVLVHCASRPAASRPVVLGARHLANAATQVRSVEWRDASLRVTLDAPAPMDLVVWTPDEWRRADTDAATTGETTIVTATPGENRFAFTTSD
ncbi:alpha-galactosidase [Halomarina oriensis]|uniref:Alpha-galactosidase n=1 Tax=Halomarina oriensis TaxID=671145 RepID=A0A6B0GI40_9EURY|nr:alpha-galactosidase [Halomarina oriensis]